MLRASATSRSDSVESATEIPLVAGQQYAYIVKASEDFRDGRRTNDGGSMQPVVRGVGNQDIEALAQ